MIHEPSHDEMRSRSKLLVYALGPIVVALSAAGGWGGCCQAVKDAGASRSRACLAEIHRRAVEDSVTILLMQSIRCAHLRVGVKSGYGSRILDDSTESVPRRITALPAISSASVVSSCDDVMPKPAPVSSNRCLWVPQRLHMNLSVL